MDRFVVLEKLRGHVDAHRQHVGDGFIAIADGERLSIELPAVANGTRDEQIGQEPHFNSLDALPLALLGAPALGVETESSEFVAKLFGVLGADEQTSYFVEDARERGWVRSRRATDWRLVDVNEPV
jgi:hypothetical protein